MALSLVAVLPAPAVDSPTCFPPAAWASIDIPRVYSAGELPDHLHPRVWSVLMAKYIWRVQLPVLTRGTYSVEHTMKQHLLSPREQLHARQVRRPWSRQPDTQHRTLLAE